MILNALLYFICSVLGTSVSIYLYYTYFKQWITGDPKIRKTVYTYYGFQDYMDSVRNYYQRLAEHRTKVESLLKMSIGKDIKEIEQEYNNLYKELDQIILEYDNYRREYEKNYLEKN